MIAGLNLFCDIWRMNYADDDTVGGAVITGTVVYQNIGLNMQELPVEQLLLQQGLETQKSFRGTIAPGNLDVRERDEIEITSPYNHPYFEERFRIVNARHSSFVPDDPRSYIMLTMVRSVRAHSQQ